MSDGNANADLGRAADAGTEPDYSQALHPIGWRERIRARFGKPKLEGLGLEVAEPRGSTGSHTESLQGTDERQNVTETTNLPWSAICHLETEYGTGTGFLISPRFVLTAAHVLYPPRGHRPVRSVRVMPGRTQREPVAHMRVSSDYYISPNWRPDENNPRFDYGVIALPDDGFKSFGSFGLKVLNDSALLEFRKRSVVFTVAGYPTDKPYGSLWMGKGQLREFGKEAIAYQVDTQRGQSGAPVFAYSEAKEPVAFAIHIQGLPTYNLARRIHDLAASDIARQIGDPSIVAA
jgi:V8-like Glu-specific endopeptidase